MYFQLISVNYYPHRGHSSYRPRFQKRTIGLKPTTQPSSVNYYLIYNYLINFLLLFLRKNNFILNEYYFTLKITIYLNFCLDFFILLSIMIMFKSYNNSMTFFVLDRRLKKYPSLFLIFSLKLFSPQGAI